MNPFQLMPLKARQAFYLAYAASAMVVTSITAGFGAIGHDVPSWVLWAGGALVPIGGALGVTAASNALKPKGE